jgi:hypothetical protein
MRGAHPLSSGLGVGEESGRIEGLVPFEHEVDGPADLVGVDLRSRILRLAGCDGRAA